MLNARFTNMYVFAVRTILTRKLEHGFRNAPIVPLSDLQYNYQSFSRVQSICILSSSWGRPRARCQGSALDSSLSMPTPCAYTLIWPWRAGSVARRAVPRRRNRCDT